MDPQGRVVPLLKYNLWTGPAGAVSPTGRVPATNLFQEGTIFDLYVYVSEQKEFGEFHVSYRTFFGDTGMYPSSYL